MHGQGHIFPLGYFVAFAACTSLAFNIDTKNAEVFAGDRKDFFGYKVLQFKSGTDKGIIVTAPLQQNGTGGVCKIDHKQTNGCFSPEDISLPNGTVPVKHFGLSIAEDPTTSSFTVCSPSVGHECFENTYLNSVCYKMTNQLQELSSFKPAFQDCTKKIVNLVFLFDGSDSMTEEEFTKNKVFIIDIMNSLNSTSIKFAAVQFSTIYRKVFDFNDNRDSALDKLMKEGHMKKLTNTYSALTFVLKQLFENPNSGASLDATQVVVLITDGDPSQLDKNNIVEKYDKKNIIRFVIGVKKAKLDKFKDIASEPKKKNVFQIEDYNGLTGLLENLQKKVFNLEGSNSKVARAGNMTNEMSQSGFSAVFHKDTLILGSVGTNSWSGALQELQGQNMTQIEDSDMPMDSYMGYSVSVGERNKVPLYFSGAPRFLHIGQVILFRQIGQMWAAAQRINGDQFGSYFGAELCSVDINSDGDTDFLLVGAPLFFQPSEKKEGQVYVYSLTDERTLKKELVVSVASMGRFGTTISSLADLNGDKLRDVAVGAPLEDENRGAVYIYLGDRNKGIRSTFSQRIMGQTITPDLRYFGQAIDGDMDLGVDGLTDVVVGSQGMAVVLSSKPVFNVIARLSFHPEEISTEKIDCLSNKGEILPMVTVKVCFQKTETTKSEAAAVSSGLNITYTLDVDPMRQKNRGFFNLDNRARNIISTYMLMHESTCFNYSIYMPKCVTDTLSPVPIKLHFHQSDNETASAVLNVDSIRQAALEIPFEKQCRGNDTCIADLKVDFKFMTPTLLVAEDNYFNVSITLSNHGDDSYNTSLTMRYPQGLSFSRMTLTNWTRPTLHSCYDLKDVLDRTTCGISRPVYRSRSSAEFLTSFLVTTNYKWGDTISMTVTGESDNMNSTTNSLTKTIPVQFEVRMAMTVSEDSITYLNFTTEDTAPKRLVARYKVDNIGLKAFPVNVSLFFPTKLEHNFEMTNYRVILQQNKTECVNTGDMKSEYCSREKNCKIVTCDSFILEKESAVEFELSGDVQFKDVEQHAANIAFFKKYSGNVAEVNFKSFLRVDYDKQRYVLNSYRQEEKSNKTGDPTLKSNEVRVEFVIPPDRLQIISTGAGLGLLLLIIITVIMFKLGCFKRKTYEDYEAKEAALRADSSTELNPQPINGTGSQPEAEVDSEEPLEASIENKTSLDGDEPNE